MSGTRRIGTRRVGISEPTDGGVIEDVEREAEERAMPASRRETFERILNLAHEFADTDSDGTLRLETAGWAQVIFVPNGYKRDTLVVLGSSTSMSIP